MKASETIKLESNYGANCDVCSRSVSLVSGVVTWGGGRRADLCERCLAHGAAKAGEILRQRARDCDELARALGDIPDGEWPTWGDFSAALYHAEVEHQTGRADLPF